MHAGLSQATDILIPEEIFREKSLFFKEELEKKIFNFLSEYAFKFINSKYLREIRELQNNLRKTNAKMADQIGTIVTSATDLAAVAVGTAIPVATPIVAIVKKAISDISKASVEISKIVNEREMLKGDMKVLRDTLKITFVLEQLLQYFENKSQPDGVRGYFREAIRLLAKHVTSALYLRFIFVIKQVRKLNGIDNLVEFLDTTIKKYFFEEERFLHSTLEIFLGATFPDEYSGDFVFSTMFKGNIYLTLRSEEGNDYYPIAKIFYWAKRVDVFLDNNEELTGTIYVLQNQSIRNQVNNFPPIIQKVDLKEKKLSSLKTLEGSAWFTKIETDANNLNNLLSPLIRQEILSEARIREEIEIRMQNTPSPRPLLSEFLSKATSSIEHTDTETNQERPKLSILRQEEQLLTISSQKIDDSLLNSDSDESEDEMLKLEDKLDRLVSLRGFYAKAEHRAQDRIDHIRNKILYKKLKSDIDSCESRKLFGGGMFLKNSSNSATEVIITFENLLRDSGLVERLNSSNVDRLYISFGSMPSEENLNFLFNIFFAKFDSTKPICVQLSLPALCEENLLQSFWSRAVSVNTISKISVQEVNGKITQHDCIKNNLSSPGTG